MIYIKKSELKKFGFFYVIFKNTIRKYVHDILMFEKWLRDKEITKSVILEYKKELISKYSAISVNSYLSSLNSFFILAVKL